MPAKGEKVVSRAYVVDVEQLAPERRQRALDTRPRLNVFDGGLTCALRLRQRRDLRRVAGEESHGRDVQRSRDVSADAAQSSRARMADMCPPFTRLP